MFPIPEQFSNAAKSQLESQLQILSTLTNKVFESAEKIIALNLNAGKAALSHTAETAQHLLETQDPRDFFSYSTSQAQPNIESVLAYSRQLFGIASSTQAELLASAKARLDAAAPADAPAAARAPAPSAAAPAAPVARLASVPAAPLPLAATLPIAASGPVEAAADVKPGINAAVKQPAASKPAIQQNGASTASKAVAKPASRGKRK